MRFIISCAAALLISACCAFSSEGALERYLPPPDSSRGWRFDIEPTRYSTDNLFEYINGEAELYHDYGFVDMVTAAYIRGDDFSFTYTIDLYDMGTPLNSFGIYSSYRNPGANLVEIGAEASVSELNIRFYLGRFFVQMNAGSLTPELHQIMVEQAQWMAAHLPSSPPPLEIGFMPAEDQIKGSLKYITKGFLGQAAFPGGLQAFYAIDGDTLQAFLVLTQTAAEAEKSFHVYTNHLKTRGKVLTITSSEVEAEMPYQGRITALRHLHWITGCMGYKARKTADRLLQHLMTTLGE